MQAINNSLTQAITPHDIAVRARLLRKDKENTNKNIITIVIVEGYVDQEMLSIFLDINCCVIIYGYGKTKAKIALKILLDEKVDGVILILDDDYDSLEQKSCRGDHICVSDTHDLETLVLNSPALEKLINSLLHPDTRAYLSEFSKDFRNSLLEIGKPIGLIRWMSYRENLFLDFKKLRLKKFINFSTFSTDEDLLIEEVLYHNNGCTYTKEIVFKKITELGKKGVNPWILCQGHDLIKIIFLILPLMLTVLVQPKDYTKEEYKKEIIRNLHDDRRLSSLLIMSYENVFFHKTIMYQDLRNWEERNKPYKLLSG